MWSRLTEQGWGRARRCLWLSAACFFWGVWRSPGLSANLSDSFAPLVLGRLQYTAPLRSFAPFPLCQSPVQAWQWSGTMDSRCVRSRQRCASDPASVAGSGITTNSNGYFGICDWRCVFVCEWRCVGERSSAAREKNLTLPTPRACS